MKIAIASGKGGTGKTTVAVNLALSLENVRLLDCDVEEPNCNLFLAYELEKITDVNNDVPVVDDSKCDHCGHCARFCRYNALAILPEKVLVFASLCHGCGGCKLVCPNDAISEQERTTGVIRRGYSQEDRVELYEGLLNIGEPMATPVINKLKTFMDPEGINIIDAPPGTACPVIATLKECDYCILVTEPTPFGLYDLKLAVDVVRNLDLAFGVIINRSDMGDERVERYCNQENIDILLRIPHDLNIANLYSKGIPFVQEMPYWRSEFKGVYETIKDIVGVEK